MRKFLISVMLASVALPAAAIAGDEDRDARRAARAEQRADRPERADRAERGSSRQTQQQQAPQQQQQQQAPQQQQQQPQQPAMQQQMRIERTDRGPDPQAQAARQARQIERQQQRGNDGQPPSVRPDREQRNWNGGNAAGQPNVQQVDTVREHRNRGPRVITTDGLPGDVRQGRIDRVQRPDRIDRVEERDLARRSRMPGLPPTMNHGPRLRSSSIDLKMHQTLTGGVPFENAVVECDAGHLPEPQKPLVHAGGGQHHGPIVETHAHVPVRRRQEVPGVEPSTYLNDGFFRGQNIHG